MMLAAAQATDCTSVSDAHFCPSTVVFIGTKRWQSLVTIQSEWHSHKVLLPTQNQ